MFLARVALLAVVMLAPVFGIAAGVRAYEAWSVPGVLRGPGAHPVPGRPFRAEVGLIVVSVAGMAAPPTDELLLGVTVSGRDSAASFYRRLSDGRWDVQARVVDHVALPAAAGCPIESWGSQALDAVRARQASLDGITNLVFALPSNPACTAAGWAETGGRVIWLIGPVPPVAVVHELAHNWGAGHASTAGCPAPGGGLTPSGCTDEYGDPFDAMGSGWGLGVLNRVAIGLIGQDAIATVDSTGLVRLSALGTGGVQGIRFTAGPGEPGDVVLELRIPGPLEPAGVAEPGRVLAHRPSSQGGTSLIDGHPETDTLFDAGLAPGESLPLPRDRWVTVRSIEGTMATLEVGMLPR